MTPPKPRVRGMLLKHPTWRRLSPRARSVFDTLWEASGPLTDSPDGGVTTHARMLLNTIAQRQGCTSRTVSRAVARLVDAGIVCRKLTGRSSRFELIVPSEVVSPLRADPGHDKSVRSSVPSEGTGLSSPRRRSGQIRGDKSGGSTTHRSTSPCLPTTEVAVDAIARSVQLMVRRGLAQHVAAKFARRFPEERIQEVVDGHDAEGKGPGYIWDALNEGWQIDPKILKRADAARLRERLEKTRSLLRRLPPSQREATIERARARDPRLVELGIRDPNELELGAKLLLEISREPGLLE